MIRSELQPSPTPVTPALQILLYASESSARRVAQRLAEEFTATVTTVVEERRCLDLLQHKTFDLLVIEEVLAQEDADNLRPLYDLAADVLLCEVNLGISNLDRIVREVRGGFARQQRECRRARHTAMLSLQRELSDSVAGLLLESQLALRHAGPELAPVLDHLVFLADALCQKLRP